MDTSVIAPAITGRIAHTWAGHRFVLMGKGHRVFALRPGKNARWKRVASYTNPELQSVTTYVVSPKGNKLILISPVKPALHVALSDSIQAGITFSAAANGYLALPAAYLATRFEVAEGALIGIASEQAAKGNALDAVRLLATLSEIYPKSFRTQLALGDAAVKLGDRTRANVAYQHSIELNPQVTESEKRDAERARAAVAGRTR